MSQHPQFVLGQQLQLTALFVNSTNTPTAPTTITFIVSDPNGLQTTVAAPNAAITNPSTGTYIYTHTIAFAIAGTWNWRIKSTGTIVNAQEGSVIVQPSLVPTP